MSCLLSRGQTLVVISVSFCRPCLLSFLHLQEGKKYSQIPLISPSLSLSLFLSLLPSVFVLCFFFSSRDSLFFRALLRERIKILSLFFFPLSVSQFLSPLRFLSSVSDFTTRIMIMEKGPMQSNLECFLDCTTPVVPSQFLNKTEMRNLNRLWHPWEREKVEYFTLGDFWNCFDEWSAYGAGVPISLDSGETVVQYYVPYLSAIQIFTSNTSATNLREETDSVFETRDSFSDSFSDESASEKASRWDGCSSEDGGSDHDSLWHLNERLGCLYFQFFERSTPYGRVPLFDKINGLAQRYPGLKSLKSVDLSPASWMAVAWYPIYHIPMGRTIKDLSTSFLTYHTLSSSFQDTVFEDELGYVGKKREEGEGIPLPPFGLATYKMQGNVWISNQGSKDQDRLVSLSSVADSWLKQLGVQHHDFNYFTGSIRRG